MGYKFRRKDKSVAEGVRRIATEQIDGALAELDDPTMDLATKVHQLRKHAKKLRGLIRMVRPGFAGYATENAVVRDAARSLSGLRDTGGMIETFDKVMSGTATDPAEFHALRAFLIQGQRQAEAQPRMEAALTGFGATLLQMRGRVPDWKIKGTEMQAIQPGVAKTWARAGKAMHAFARDPSDANVHEWRKRVKYHWYHCRLLAPCKPGKLTHRAHDTRDLSELLGDHHDITVLRHALLQAGDLPASARCDAFLDLAARHQDDLRKQALKSGKGLFGKPPKKALKFWSQWWKDWRAA